MSEQNPAVFLSYASQDAEAARRICEALSAAGIEVWFDQSELRGGDAWDQRIRQQIRGCALFIPIVSANTQTRLEGYFRREWRLAVDRTLDMADGKPFLIPVAVDGTPDKNAHVPEAFRAVQWTRLLGGETSPDFVQRVSRLLGRGSQEPVTFPPAMSRAAAALPAKRRVPTSALIIGAALVIAAGYFAFGLFQAAKEESAVIPTPPIAPATATNSAIADKSIAVLPFVDMSEKHDQEYFSDGLAEELLNLLSKVPDLQVIARTSSFSFKGTSDDIPAIAKKLSVAHILEGSVRKSGRRMRITTQLIRVDSGAHVWSETYDRDVEDVFKVQDEIARIVVEKLKGTLMMGTPAVAARTTNPEAHTLYLQAQYFRALDTEEGLDTAIEKYQRAVALDPGYAPAWSGLSAAYARKLANGGKAGDPMIVRAREAAEKAIQLDPRTGEAYATRAFLQMMVDFAWPQAGQTLARGRELDPANVTVLYVSGVQARTVGQESAAVGFFRQALERDPVNLLTRRYFARTLLHANRVAEAEAEIQRLLEMSPAFPAAHYMLGLILLEKREPGPALAAFEAETSRTWRPFGLPLGLHAVGRTRDAEAALAKLDAGAAGSEFQLAEACAFMGKTEEAFKWLDAATANRDPGIIWLRGNPLFRPLGGDPRYAALLRKLNLAN